MAFHTSNLGVNYRDRTNHKHDDYDALKRGGRDDRLFFLSVFSHYRFKL